MNNRHTWTTNPDVNLRSIGKSRASKENVALLRAYRRWYAVHCRLFAEEGLIGGFGVGMVMGAKTSGFVDRYDRGSHELEATRHPQCDHVREHVGRPEVGGSPFEPTH